MLAEIIAFLVMLNPFAMFLYLNPVMKELKPMVFLKVLFKASSISFVIFWIFFAFGDLLMNNVFQISFDAFRIFGGIIIFSMAYLYIIKGQKSLINMKEDLDDLASEIALPFMIGAGTLSLAILMSYKFSILKGTFMLIVILTINYFFIIFLKVLKTHISRKTHKIAFDKNMEVLLRLFGFFVGAIGINMIVVGISNLFF